jgi:D-3-phosphoglycerate dehydrogenase
MRSIFRIVYWHPLRITALHIHKNLPNMVGQMTAILAKAGLNIEEMVNKSRGEIAYTVFDLNKAPDKDIMNALSAIESVIKIREIGKK